MNNVKYPENIELKKALRFGDIRAIARASGKSEGLINLIFMGTRRMKPEVRRVYDMVVDFNHSLDEIVPIDKKIDKKPNV